MYIHIYIYIYAYTEVHLLRAPVGPTQSDDAHRAEPPQRQRAKQPIQGNNTNITNTTNIDNDDNNNNDNNDNDNTR